MHRPVDGQQTNEDLGDRALRLAEDGFNERVGALITEARGDRTRLAVAATSLSTNGAAHGESKRQIAFALLIAAAHSPTADRPQLRLVKQEGASSGGSRTLASDPLEGVRIESH